MGPGGGQAPSIQHMSNSHFPLLSFQDTEIGPGSLRSSHREDARVILSQATGVTCGKGQSSPMEAERSTPLELGSMLMWAQGSPVPPVPQSPVREQCLFPCWGGEGQVEQRL
jgi:hypothetical protein